MQRVGFVRGALAEQRVDDGGAQLLRERDDRLARVGDHGAVAHVEQGALGGLEEIGRCGDRLRVAAAGDRVAGQVHLVDEGRVAGALGHVLGQIDEHRARSSRRGEVEGLARDARERLGIADEIAVLDDGVGDAGDVRFLEGVLAEEGADLLPTEHDDRSGVHQRGQQSGDGVGGARAGGHENHARLAGGARIAVGHVGRALFVAREDELDARVHESIEDWHRSTAREPEDVLDTLTFEALDELLGACCCFRVHLWRFLDQWKGDSRPNRSVQGVGQRSAAQRVGKTAVPETQCPIEIAAKQERIAFDRGIGGALRALSGEIDEFEQSLAPRGAARCLRNALIGARREPIRSGTIEARLRP